VALACTKQIIISLQDHISHGNRLTKATAAHHNADQEAKEEGKPLLKEGWSAAATQHSPLLPVLVDICGPHNCPVNVLELALPVGTEKKTTPCLSHP
jgi:hypothetical protein